MNHTQKAIEDAIAGGWQPKETNIPVKVGQRSLGGNWISLEIGGNEYAYLVPNLLLDPTFWQAVGKTRGWVEEIDETDYCRCSVTGERAKRNPVFLADCLCHRESGMRSEYIEYWHRFIDHLADGLSIEDALKAISE